MSQNTSHSDAEKHSTQTIKDDPAVATPARIRGLIQRGINELNQQRNCNWIERTHKLKFQRLENKK